MDKLELLQQLQTIENKLKNDQELSDDEYKLFTTVLLSLSIGIVYNVVEVMFNIIKGDEDE